MQPNGLQQRSAALVGRHAEIALIADQLVQAQRGRCRVVMLAGEPGIGKTHLLDTVAARAVQDGIAMRRGVQHGIAADPAAVPLLQRFPGVYVQDGSTIVLPPALADLWHGCGGSTDAGTAAIKLQVQRDLCTGAVSGLELHHIPTNCS